MIGVMFSTLLTVALLGTQTEWRSYGADAASTKYSPLAQINATNAKSLKVAWRWRSPDEARFKKDQSLQNSRFEATAIVAHGTLYVPSSLGEVVALDPTTGKTKWTLRTVTGEEEPNYAGPPTSRGVAYANFGPRHRIFYATRRCELVSIDTDSHQLDPAFGKHGVIDLKKDLAHPPSIAAYMTQTSPPIVCGNVVVVGSRVIDNPTLGIGSGDVRGYDARTGRLVWTFHTVPQPGEFGEDTWKNGSAKDGRAANVWTWMSYDPKLNAVYLPVSTPANDFYGVGRPGDGLFGESLVCLDARTGKRRWHQQLVHHGLWDYDLPCAPNLVDIKVNGKRIHAVAQVTKQAYCYVFDRETGKPVWPIVERPVAASNVPGEQASLTQPIPTKPLPFDRQGITDADLMDFTPELKKAAQDYVDHFTHGPLFTPPDLDKPVLSLPGTLGGASWSGAAVDPETGWLYVPSVTYPAVEPLVHAAKQFQQYFGKEAFGTMDYPSGPAGLFVTKPPYGRITAIDLNSGNQVWRSVLGEGPRNDPRLRALHLPKLGWPARGHTLLTKTLVVVCQEEYWMPPAAPVGKPMREFPPQDGPARGPHGFVMPTRTERAKLRAFDKRTGQLLAEIPLPGNPGGAPMTYEAHGHQYIVVALGGGFSPAQLVAYRLP